MKKRILSLFLALLMVLLAVPTALFPVAAAEAEENTEGKDVVLSTTVFAPDKDTFPVFGRYDAATMSVGQYVDVTYPDAWQIGYQNASGDFTAYKKLYKANAEGQMILAADDSYKTQSGGVIITDAPALMFSGASDPAIRYTAEYTGTAVIRLNELYFYADNAAALEILHNGEPVISPFMAKNSLHRADASYAKGTASNVGADLGVIAVEVTKGDVIDFVSRAQDSFSVEELASYGLWDFEIEISYLSGKDGSHTATSGSLAELSNDLPLPLFVWYDYLGNRLDNGDARQGDPTSADGFFDQDGFLFFPGLTDWTGTEGFAKINPALIESGVILENYSYTTILSAYKDYLKAFVSATYDGAFTAGTLAGGAVSTANRFPLVSDRNLFSVGMNGSTLTSLVDYSFARDRLVSEAALFSAIDAFFANAASVTPSGSTAADLSIPASTLAEGKAFSAAGTNPTGGAAIYKNNALYLAPNGGVSVLSYVVPSTLDQVILSLTPTSLAFDGEASAFRFAVAVNGTVVWPAAENTANWAEASSLAELQNALASLSFTAKGGDTVSLCIADTDTPVSVGLSVAADNYHNVRALEIVSGSKTLYSGLHELDSTVTLAELGLPASFGKNGVFINYATDSVSLPKTLVMSQDYYVADRVLATYASISIDSAFALNLYVEAENGATDAGIIIDGEKHAGEALASGMFLVTLPIAPKEMPEKVFSYRAYQTLNNEDTVNEEPVSLNVFELLSTYEADEDASTALLARTIRYYSLAARDYFINERVTLTEDVQTALCESDTDILDMVAAYRAGTDYVAYPAGTNVNAFTYRIKSASLKLDDRLGFAFRVDRTDGALFGTPDLTLRVTNEEGEICYTTRVTEPFDEDGKEVLYFVKNLPATRYGTSFSFTLVDAEHNPVSATLMYSAHAYIARTFDAVEGDATTFHYLLRGIYALGKASAAYETNHVDFDKNYYFPVGDGGDALEDGSPVLSQTAYDPSNAASLSAAQLATTTLSNGGVYRLTESATLSGSSFNGNGAVLIAPDGLVIDGKNGFTLSNVTIAGPLVIRNSQNVIIENSQILHEGATAVTVESTASDIVLNACRIVGRDAVVNAANELTVMNSYLGFERYGVRDTADVGTTVENCRLVGSGVCEAIHSEASEAAFRFNTVLLDKSSAYGIVLAGDGTTQNVLVAQNVIRGAYESLTVSGMLNTSVVLNSMVMVRAQNNKNLYVCDNAVGGKLVLENNNYLLADGNIYPTDEKDHAATSFGNDNVNGDDVTDVNARAEVGVNEELLPHVNKDLFVGMERKDGVKEAGKEGTSTLYTYLAEHAKTENYVVVAPGVYKVNARNAAVFAAAQSNTVIYAYGVYAEGVQYPNDEFEYPAGDTVEHRNFPNNHMRFNGAENVAVKGLTIGYAEAASGQVYVLSTNRDGSWLSGYTYTATVVAGAGIVNAFANSGSPYFSTTSIYLHRNGQFLGEYSITSVTNNTSDGTMTIQLSAALYEVLKKGDVLTCRLRAGAHTVLIEESSNISFTDVTTYGYSGGFMFHERYNLSATTYLRVCNTSRSGEIISESAYNNYRSIEDRFDIDLDISTDTLADGTIRYRGSSYLVGSQDVLHGSFNVQGANVVSSIFENMCDDGTNQGAFYARLSEIRDNGDGTATIIYKASLSQYMYKYGSTSFSGLCAAFRAGDRVYIHTSGGKLVCDATALADGEYLDTIPSTYTNLAGKDVARYAVTVDMSKVNPGAFSDYDLDDDSPAADQKVLVENLSRSSANAKFDNCLIQNGHTNGLRLKAPGGVITNCTFRNLAKTAVSLVYDIWWGESGVAQDFTLESCIIDHTGYAPNERSISETQFDIENVYKFCPITIMGLGGSSLDEDNLLFSDIRILNNKFLNRVLDHYNYAIYARAVNRLTVTGNDFGSLSSETSSKHCGVLYLNGAANVELSGNTYSSYVSGNYSLYVKGSPYKNIFGTDVTVNGVSQIQDKT